MCKIDFILVRSPLFFPFFQFQSSLVNWEIDESLRDIGAGTRVATKKQTYKKKNTTRERLCASHFTRTSRVQSAARGSSKTY